MKLEVHLLQNFAPSNLNRDDTNTPKDCEFGGYRRARISSQCIKRSIRKHFNESELLPKENLAERTKKLVDEVVGVLKEKGRDEAAAIAATNSALAAISLKIEDNKTQYLLFLGRTEIARLADLIHHNWEALTVQQASAPETDGKKKSAKAAKSDAKAAVPADISKQVKALFDGGKAADLALFGRMLADMPELNKDAACQVAHAISTNKMNLEMDFFTAVDDLKESSEDAGAGMLGNVEFNSACFYRYANIDLNQLKSNLQDDKDLTLKTVEAFLKASVEAIPSGKQNSMAAHNPPSLVFVVLRKRGLQSLANAFVEPVRPEQKSSLIQKSINNLDDYYQKLIKMYGKADIQFAKSCNLDELKTQLGETAKDVETLFNETKIFIEGSL